jgi:hypothetical protein
VTERRRAEEAIYTSDATLRASEERYRTLLNSIDVGFCVVEMIFDSLYGEGHPPHPVDYAFWRRTRVRTAYRARRRLVRP